MPQIQVVSLRDQWGVYSWTQGFNSIRRELPLEQEAQKHPEAVVNRLMREGRWQEAERILDVYI